MQDSSAISIDLHGRTPPAFIAVEGPIGVGKTTLTKKLAASFNYQTLLEDAEENPFLEKFYRNPKQAALATQLFFLFQRSQKLQDIRQPDIFEPVRVAAGRRRQISSRDENWMVGRVGGVHGS